MALTVLHTSDWHLGRSLYGQKRYEEFDAFLDWMITTLAEQQTDVLLIAGDIFDTSTPGNRATQQYYSFLTRVGMTGCRHVVIIGGNHDSPTFLNAPRDLLKTLNIHVVGARTENIEDEVIVLRDNTDSALAIVCATPYLRDRDIRSVEAGESIADKEQKLLDGISRHYAAVTAYAEQCHAALSDAERATTPIIAMGHLFAAGGHTEDGDGVRDLYVGSLAHVRAGIFPDALDYVALGHLHVPQAVAGQAHIRYCGSPLPMGFGEAMQQKSVCLLHFEGRKPTLNLLPVPCFQRLRQLRGNLAEVQTALQNLAQAGTPTWVEVIYTGETQVTNLREQLQQILTDNTTKTHNPVTLLRIRNQHISTQNLIGDSPDQTLDDLTPPDVFERCLDAHGVPADQRQALQLAFREILNQLCEHDPGAD